jgi:hypothetical protein
MANIYFSKNGTWYDACDSSISKSGTWYDLSSVGGFSVCKNGVWYTNECTFIIPALGGFDNLIREITYKNNKYYIGGDFTTYSGTTTPTGITKNRFIVLNSDGSIDNTVEIGDGFNNTIRTISFDNTKILIGGQFTTYSGVTYNRIIKLNSNGSIDNTFQIGNGIQAGANAVLNFLKTADNGYIVTGDFETYSGITKGNIVKIFNNGEIDSTFKMGVGVDDANDVINSISIDSSDRILVAGRFSTYSGLTVNNIFRINSDGSIDNTFPLNGTNNSVSNVDIDSDGNIYLAGVFSSYSGITYDNLVKLKSNGYPDESFINYGFSGTINSIKTQTNNKLLVGGSITSYSGISVNGLVRLNSNGDFDHTLNINDGFNFGSIVRVIETIGNDKIIMGGTFSTYNNELARNIVLISSGGTRIST